MPFGKMRIDCYAPIRAVAMRRNGKYAILDESFCHRCDRQDQRGLCIRSNPFRMSFDHRKTVAGRCRAGRAEVDNIVNGGNYGWPFREGSSLTRGPYASQRPSTDPIADYTSDGIAVMGGFVYHGCLS